MYFETKTLDLFMKEATSRAVSMQTLLLFLLATILPRLASGLTFLFLQLFATSVVHKDVNLLLNGPIGHGVPFPKISLQLGKDLIVLHHTQDIVIAVAPSFQLGVPAIGFGSFCG